MARGPMHAGTLETSLDDQFVGAFHHTPPLRPKRLRLEKRLSLLERGQILLRLACRIKRSDQVSQPAQNRLGATVFEQMETPFQRVGGQGGTGEFRHVSAGTQALGSVRKSPRVAQRAAPVVKTAWQNRSLLLLV